MAISRTLLDNYAQQSPLVNAHANRVAASVAQPGTPEYSIVYDNALIKHARDFGRTEGRAGATELITNVDREIANNTVNVPTTTSNMTAPPRTDPVDLSPVTSAVQGVSDRIGTAGTGQTDLFAGQAGIMSGQQNLANIVRPLGEQVTGLETSIGTAAENQAPTLMGQTAGLARGQEGLATDIAGVQAGIGTAGTGDELGTGLVGGQERLSVGQLALAQGQSGLGRQIGQAGGELIDTRTGETATIAPTGLFAGQAELATGQEGLQTGQEQLGTQIGALGTAAVTDPDTGEVTQKPTGLFAGQAGLMAGQTGLTQDISGLGRELSDVSADIGGQLTGLGGQLGAFRSGVEQYQRGATTQRGDIQGTQRAGQANLLAQIQGVGQQANRAAEAIAQQRQMQTQIQQPAVQQQAAQFARSAPRATPSNQQVGPMGPMASDPRDVLIQNLLRNASLMNRRPV